MPSAAELRALGQYVSEPKPGRGRQLMELLGQTWPARAAKETANAIGGYVHHVGESVAGRADPMDVRPAVDFTLAVGAPSYAMAPMKEGPGLFGGMMARTAPSEDYNRFARMEQETSKFRNLMDQEVDVPVHKPQTMWEETGWFRDADKKAKFEISDEKAALDDWAFESVGRGIERKLKDVLNHPELYKAYPHLADMPVTNQTPKGAWGVFDDRAGRIGLDTTRPPKEVLDTLLHEVQHAIQKKEGFARGGSAEQFRADPTVIANTQKQFDELADATNAIGLFDDVAKRKEWLRAKGYEPGSDAWEYASNLKYEDTGPLKEAMARVRARIEAAGDEGRVGYARLLGEAEARRVPHRRTLTDEERRLLFPQGSDPYGVKPKDWIIHDQMGRPMLGPRT